MTALKYVRQFLSPLIGSGLAVSISGASIVTTSVRSGSFASFNVGIGLVVAGVLMAACGGYLAGRAASPK